MSYKGIVARVQNILPHPNADRLEIAIVLNTHVVVGINNYKPDDLVLFFESDGCLSKEYCEANDLYERFEEIDGVKTRVGSGYLDPNGRIRALNLRSYKSNGLVMPLPSLAFTGVDLSILVEGYTFTEINNVEICRKYETPATKAARNQKQKKVGLKNKTVFREHIETENFRRNVQRIPVGATISITEKLHGTSGRIGYVYSEKEERHPLITKFLLKTNKKLPWEPLDQLWQFIHKTIEKKSIKTIKGHMWQHGTRKVVLQKESANTGFYGSDEFRWQIADRLLPFLHKGEQIYYEIVGETTSGAKIQSNHSTICTGDKKFIKQYGSEVSYNYSCPDSTCKAYVYRISIINEDGVEWELPWEAVKARCLELGVDYVPEHKVIKLSDFSDTDLIRYVEDLSLQSTFENQFPEGVVIRVDYNGKTWWLKEKNWYFLRMEGFNKEKPDYVDTEEVES